MLKRIINKILFSIYGEDVLITKEGWSYLNDPVKRVKLRQWIELYHKTGVWDHSFWDEPKNEELNQSDVVLSLPNKCTCLGGSTDCFSGNCTVCGNRKGNGI